MRRIERAGAFKRDYKRVVRSTRDLDTLLVPVLKALVNDQPLPDRYRDHPLSGTWAGYRDCHIKPDLLLLYSKPDDDALYLARLGSHSELF